MPQETTMALAETIGLVIQLLTFLGGLYFFTKKFPLEKKAVEAEATNDTASAQLSLAEADAKRLDNQGKMIALLLERDNQIAELSSKVVRLSAQVSEIEVLRERLERTNEELKEERQWRVKLQRQLEESESLAETYRLERDRLKKQVATLSERFDTLEENVKSTKSATIVQE